MRIKKRNRKDSRVSKRKNDREIEYTGATVHASHDSTTKKKNESVRKTRELFLSFMTDKKRSLPSRNRANKCAQFSYATTCLLDFDDA